MYRRLLAAQENLKVRQLLRFGWEVRTDARARYNATTLGFHSSRSSLRYEAKNNKHQYKKGELGVVVLMHSLAVFVQFVFGVELPTADFALVLLLSRE